MTARMKMMPKFLEKKAVPLRHLPQLFSEEPSLDKRKILNELLSLSTSSPKDAPGRLLLPRLLLLRYLTR
jgi:hypothetical protein